MERIKILKKMCTNENRDEKNKNTSNAWIAETIIWIIYK